MQNEQQINKYAGEYLRLVEVAEWLKVYPSTVCRWVKKGKIPAPIKWNGVVLFDVQAIRDAMKAAQSETVDGEAKNTESNTVTGTAGTQPTGKATEPEAHGGEALPELPKSSEYREAI